MIDRDAEDIYIEQFGVRMTLEEYLEFCKGSTTIEDLRARLLQKAVKAAA